MNSAASAIDRRAISMTHKRKADATLDSDGLAVPGAETTTTIKAVIQPVKGNQLMDIPEGLRTEAGWMCWSRSSLIEDDVIVFSSISYRVLFAWPRHDGNFYRAALGRTTP